MENKSSLEKARKQEALKEVCEKGGLLALWRLKDFLILYKEVDCISVQPTRVRIVDEACIDASQKGADEKEAKLNAAFLIGFSALEALLNFTGV
jgi:hypothetical protein